jgi:hypothetical protein
VRAFLDERADRGVVAELEMVERDGPLVLVVDLHLRRAVQGKHQHLRARALEADDEDGTRVGAGVVPEAPAKLSCSCGCPAEILGRHTTDSGGPYLSGVTAQPPSGDACSLVESYEALPHAQEISFEKRVPVRVDFTSA